MVCFVSVCSDPGSMPGGGARGQNLGHLDNGLFTWCFFISKFIS